MKVLVINPIMYTSETNSIAKQDSIKDTMIYDFCLAFYEAGHDVTLIAAEPFKPYSKITPPYLTYYGLNANGKTYFTRTVSRLCRNCIGS